MTSFDKGKEAALKDLQRLEYPRDEVAINAILKSAPDLLWAAGYLREVNNKFKFLTVDEALLLESASSQTAAEIWGGFEIGVIRAAAIPAVIEMLLQLQDTPHKGPGNTQFVLGVKNHVEETGRALMTNGEKSYLAGSLAKYTKNKYLAPLEIAGGMAALAAPMVSMFSDNETVREATPYVATALSIPGALSKLDIGWKSPNKNALLLASGKAVASLAAPFFLSREINKVRSKWDEDTKEQLKSQFSGKYF